MEYIYTREGLIIASQLYLLLRVRTMPRIFTRELSTIIRAGQA